NAVGSATGAASAAGNAGGSASGSGNAAGSAAGNGMASGALGQLALAGSGAANGAGNFAVSPGMMVQDASGHAIGTIRSAKANADGKVDSLLVDTGDRIATLPASNFTASGDVVTSAMSKGEVRKEAKQQDSGAKTAAPAKD
ncbi:MAG TPA: hypothetical protein VF509_07050, partial [Sphingobium sp.]